MKKPIILKPCPFCGPVEIVHEWDGNVTIKHDVCCLLGCVVSTLFGSIDVDAWNRRYDADNGGWK